MHQAGSFTRPAPSAVRVYTLPFRRVLAVDVDLIDYH